MIIFLLPEDSVVICPMCGKRPSDESVTDIPANHCDGEPVYKAQCEKDGIFHYQIESN